MINQLEAESSKWGMERHIQSVSEDRNWELKALSRLFGQASRMTHKIDIISNITVLEFQNQVMHAITNEDWGWGENWSDRIHSWAMMQIVEFIDNFFDNQSHSIVY